MRRRIRMLRGRRVQLVFEFLAFYLGVRFLVLGRLRHVEGRRCIGGGGDIIRVEGVKAGIDPFALGAPGQLVVIRVRGRSTVLTAVAVNRRLF